MLKNNWNSIRDCKRPSVFADRNILSYKKYYYLKNKRTLVLSFNRYKNTRFVYPSGIEILDDHPDGCYCAACKKE